jgi:hypothetical protein
MSKHEIISFIEGGRNAAATKVDESLCSRALRKKWKCLIIYALAICETMILIMGRID